MFAAITPMLAIGGFAERAHLGPLLFFVFAWSTLVYDPIACWTWNPSGWTFVLGGYDFAGGTPVHISSGTAALAISVYLGKRRGYGTEALAYKPHNTTYVILGTIFLWFGWFGEYTSSHDELNVRRVGLIRAGIQGSTEVLLLPPTSEQPRPALSPTWPPASVD
jgi:Amt family ammonium transporter